jgi:hypothetical protein
MGAGLEEGLIVALLPEDLAAAVAPVDDMVADSANRGSRSAWHKERIPSRRRPKCQ